MKTRKNPSTRTSTAAAAMIVRVDLDPAREREKSSRQQGDLRGLRSWTSVAVHSDISRRRLPPPPRTDCGDASGMTALGILVVIGAAALFGLRRSSCPLGRRRDRARAGRLRDPAARSTALRRELRGVRADRATHEPPPELTRYLRPQKTGWTLYRGRRQGQSGASLLKGAPALARKDGAARRLRREAASSAAAAGRVVSFEDPIAGSRIRSSRFTGATARSGTRTAASRG